MKQGRPDAQIFLSWRGKRQICRKKEKSDATAENGDGQRDHQGSEFTARSQDERSHPEQQVDGHIEKRHRWNEGDGELRRKMNRDRKGVALSIALGLAISTIAGKDANSVPRLNIEARTKRVG